MSNVSYVHPALEAVKPIYQRNNHLLGGDTVVKSDENRLIYIPKPNPSDLSVENTARYNNYVKRAILHNILAHTVRGFEGMIFAREPEIDVPDSILSIVKNANGEGLSLEQLARRMCRFVIPHGRCGSMTDFANVEGSLTARQARMREYQPVIKVFDPMDVINWRNMTAGAMTALSMVVIKDEVELDHNEFELKLETQYKVLGIDQDTGRYQVEIYRMNGGEAELVTDIVLPTYKNGDNMKKIPFSFTGSENNDHTVDVPPMGDIAAVNIGHLINSAEFEDSAYQVGQPMVWAAGILDDEEGKTVNTGSGAILTLMDTGKAGILQPHENVLAMTGMEHKEKMLVSMCANLLKEGYMQKTATQSKIDNVNSTSMLAAMANNVSDTIEMRLRECLAIMGEDPEQDLRYRLNTEFASVKMSKEEHAQLIVDLHNNVLSWSEVRHHRRRDGVTVLDDDAAKQEIDQAMLDG